MRVALIQSEARRDGNAFSVARALRRHGHDVILVMPQIEGSPSTPASWPNGGPRDLAGSR